MADGNKKTEKGKGKGKRKGKEKGEKKTTTTTTTTTTKQGQQVKPNEKKANSTSQAHGHKGSRRICEFFQKGHCHKGNKCSYSHEVSDHDTNGGKFNNTSKHTSSTGGTNTKSPKQTAHSSHPLKDFCSGLQKSLKVRNNSGFIPNDSNLQQWKVCFESAGKERSDLGAYRSTFLNMYLKLPNEEIFAPKAENVLQVVKIYLKQKADLQTVFDIFHHRLTRPSSLKTIDDKEKIEHELNEVKNSVWGFANCGNNDRDKLMEILNQIKEYQELVTRHEISSPLKSSNVHSSGNEITNPMFGWLHQSTVEWLASGCIIGGPALKNSYKSVDDYVLSVQSVWTMLTFYWGIAALWPRCRCRQAQNDMPCGKPLLSQHRKTSQCSMQIRTSCGKSAPCINPAKWKCGFRGHDSICDRCLKKQQEQILGPSGTREASTDMYDGEVTKTYLQMDSAVLTISKVLSRKPPTVPVKWRTTYRLQPAALVGVIVMHASNVSLKKDMTIYWGEVSNTYGDIPESQLRERGDMTVRILSRADCNELPAHIDLPFAVGSKVVVIDLRVFVPEVMSVLSTLVHRSFASNLGRLPFIHPVLGCGSSSGQQRNVTALEEVTSILKQYAPSKLDKLEMCMAKFEGIEDVLIRNLKNKYNVNDSASMSPSAFVTAGHGLNEMIERAVNSSQILCIRQLPPREKQEIIDRICRIPPVRSLDETQGMAFALGLLKTLHCTQGPPGTGKSYVGVCLILALIVVREVVKRKNSYVGPIVALSYKNHALDEFLVDVLENDGSLRQRGSLIRLGKPDNPKLENFTERRSGDESDARKELERRVVVLKNAKVYVQKWRIESDISTCDSVDSVYDCLRVLSCIQDKNGHDNEEGEDLSTGAKSFHSVKTLFQAAQAKSVDAIVAKIMTDSAHWCPSSAECGFDVKNLSRQEVFLKCWLTGLTPPPRCKVVREDGRQCLNKAVPCSSFCDEAHICQFPQCLSQRHSASKSRYCSSHICKATGGCEELRLDGSDFCLDHCCPICIQQEKVGPNACTKHCCSEPHCDRLQMPPFSFCDNHCCRECVTKDAVSINSKVQSVSSYCELHTCSVAHCASLKYNIITCKEHSCVCCGVRIEEGDLCVEHRCAYEEESCSRMRAVTVDGTESHFCELHTCRFCVELGFPLIHCTFAPSYTCVEHPCCQEINVDGGECYRLASDADGLYCSDHVHSKAAESSTCAGTTTKGKPCRTTKPDQHQGVWYCSAHSSQAPPMLPPLVGAGLATNGKNNKALFAERDVSAVSFTSDLRQEAGRQIVSCCVAGCGLKEGLTNVDCSNNDSSKWKCSFHSALSRSRQIFQTLQSTAVANKVDIKVEQTPLPEESPTPKSHNTATKVIDNGNNNEDYDIIFGDEEFTEDTMGAPGQDMDAFDYVKDDIKSVSDSDSEHEDEINDANQHLRDIYGNEEEDIEGMEGIHFNDFKWDIGKITSTDLQVLFASCCGWTWNMNLQERQKTVFQLITSVSMWITQLCLEAEEYVDQARVQRAEASGRVLKTAVIIGGTIVGTVNRLSALRAAEPFAIIVEEACEVMEPTLVAVLSVDSVQKVQLIGDHRQLPAFVNDCWYDLACSMPAIKTSLFERLVVGEKEGDENIDTCSVLAVQRRMRSSISNLTKHHYADVIEIEDHDCTLSQKIGNKLTSKQRLVNAPKQKVWEGGGRLVPGLSSCVYFWNIAGNEESKNKAGISACNDIEADTIVQLVQFLVLCGISKNAITIITPYSGQKRLLADKLRKGDCIPQREKITTGRGEHGKKSFRGGRGAGRNCNDVAVPVPDSVLVSTVDRYQGDENDIVILSLVRARGGNRFVGLLNRFIVASSRARLGFYVVGSIAAVQSNHGDSHWDAFIDHLKDPTERDEGTEDNPFQGSCCTNDLPICCPQHRSSTASCVVRKQNMTSLFPQNKTWFRLCQQACSEPLPCGHSCQKPCHFVDPLAHSSCSQLIDRPCKRHKEVDLLCSSVTMQPNETLEMALSKWKCDLNVDGRLPCHHSISLKCFEFDQIKKGKMAVPDCPEIVADFVHPTCNHRIEKPTCCERQQYEKKPPICKDVVIFKRPCGHSTKMKCFEAIEEARHPQKCQQKINVKRPRCSHTISVKCHEFTQLRQQWDKCGYVGIDDNTIEEGEEYGPDEQNFLDIAQCLVPVTVRKSCGHVLTMPCSEAFEMVKTKKLPLCTDMTSASCYICLQQINIPCRLFIDYKEWNPFLHTKEISVQQLKKDGSGNQPVVLEERALTVPIGHNHSKLWAAWKTAKCSTSVSLRRSCQEDHVIPNMSCKDVLNKVLVKKEVSMCKELTKRVLACGHTIQVLCHRKNVQPPPFCRREVNEVVTFSSCDHILRPKSCGELQEIKNNPFFKCKENTMLELYRCGHSLSIPCKRKSKYAVQPWINNTLSEDQIVHYDVEYCLPCEGLKCVSEIKFQRKCGHVLTNIPCDEAFQMAEGQLEVPVCINEVQVESPLCHHNITVPCHLRNIIADWHPWCETNVVPTFDELTVGVGVDVRKVYSAPIPSPQTPLPITLSSLRNKLTCGGSTWVKFEACEHIQKVPCAKLYQMEDGSGGDFQIIACKNLIEHVCSRNCGHQRQIPCHNFNRLSLAELDANCPNLVTLPCRNCKINKVNVPCSQRHPECKSKVECILPCGHAAKPWICHTDPDPRLGHDGSSNMNENCLLCVKTTWELSRDVNVELEILQSMARNWMLAELQSDDTNILSEITLEPPFAQCHKTRDKIISKYIEAIETQGAVLKFPPIVDFPCCVEDFVRASYDLVFYEIPANKNPDKKGILKRFSREPTIYGQGKRVYLLRKHLVENLATSSGVVKLCVAMAFKCNVLTEKKPFSLNASKNDANKIMLQYRRKGFDCVDVNQRERVIAQEGKFSADCEERVYWEAGAVVPLSIVEVQLHTSCLICGDFFGRDGNLGAICDEGHFLCYKTCFLDYLSSSREAGAIGRSVENGFLKCPGCTSCYQALKLADKNCPRNISKDLLSFEFDNKVAQSNSIVRKEEEEKRKKEIDGLLKMNKVDREVRLVCNSITENILTPKCPRCKQAFFDFDGCFALTCGNNQCRAGFCAYCFEDCDDDAHRHVANCGYNEDGDVYGDVSNLHKIWKTIRRDKIQHLLNGNEMKTAVKKKVRERMKKEFDELKVV